MSESIFYIRGWKSPMRYRLEKFSQFHGENIYTVEFFYEMDNRWHTAFDGMPETELLEKMV